MRCKVIRDSLYAGNTQPETHHTDDQNSLPESLTRSLTRNPDENQLNLIRDENGMTLPEAANASLTVMMSAILYHMKNDLRSSRELSNITGLDPDTITLFREEKTKNPAAYTFVALTILYDLSMTLSDKCIKATNKPL